MVISFKIPGLDNFLLPPKSMSCIHYLLQFKKDQTKIQARLDFGIKINAMTPANIALLDLKIWSINVRA